MADISERSGLLKLATRSYQVRLASLASSTFCCLWHERSMMLLSRLHCPLTRLPATKPPCTALSFCPLRLCTCWGGAGRKGCVAGMHATNAMHRKQSYTQVSDLYIVVRCYCKLSWFASQSGVPHCHRTSRSLRTCAAVATPHDHGRGSLSNTALPSIDHMMMVQCIEVSWQAVTARHVLVTIFGPNLSVTLKFH